jgi:hypothetical protein
MSEEIYIHPLVKTVKEPLVYGNSADLLYRPVDTIAHKDLTPENIYRKLLKAAKNTLQDAGMPMPDGACITASTAMICDRRAVIVGLSFGVKGGEIVEPHDDCAMSNLRGQLGRVWN